MKRSELVSGCAGCRMSRRHFLAECAAGAGAAGALAAPGWLRAAEPGSKVRIRIVYALHAAKQAQPDWPNVGFDFGPVMERFNGELARRCPGFEFVPSLASGADPAKKILEEDQTGAIDGYLVYQMNAWNQVVQTLATSGKPVTSNSAAAAVSSSIWPISSASRRPTWALSPPRAWRTWCRR